MSGKVIPSLLNTFRKKFIIPKDRLSGENVNKWFPMHMYNSLKAMQARLRNVDCIIEVHDARIPFSGRNEQLKNLLYAIRPHILVLNKCDLIDPKLRPRIEFKLRETCKDLSHIVWTNCKSRDRSPVLNLMKLVNESLENTTRFNRAVLTEYTLMVIGIPNVGKSSLINSLRNIHGLSAAATVGARPGVTRAVQEKVRLQASPLIYMLDTPGVLAPNIRDVDVGMKMALCETVLQHLVGFDLIADYLLYVLNRRKNFKYLELTNLTEPTDDIRKLLFEIAIMNRLFVKGEKYSNIDDTAKNTVKCDLQSASMKLLEYFRLGNFGSQFLDWEFLEK